MSKMIPFSDKVIIKPVTEKSKSTVGIIRTDIEKKQYKTGTVVESGPGFFTISGEMIPNQTKPGDVVVYPKNIAIDYNFEGENFVVVRESELLIKIEE